MSWGERSCKPPCRIDNCTPEICNVNCPGYLPDGVTKPDSVKEVPVVVSDKPKQEPQPANRAQRRALKFKRKHNGMPGRK